MQQIMLFLLLLLPWAVKFKKEFRNVFSCNRRQNTPLHRDSTWLYSSRLVRQPTTSTTSSQRTARIMRGHDVTYPTYREVKSIHVLDEDNTINWESASKCSFHLLRRRFASAKHNKAHFCHILDIYIIRTVVTPERSVAIQIQHRLAPKLGDLGCPWATPSFFFFRTFVSHFPSHWYLRSWTRFILPICRFHTRLCFIAPLTYFHNCIWENMYVYISYIFKIPK